MAFRRLPTDREQWSRFCDSHRQFVEQLGRIEFAISTSDRFESLLQFGLVRNKDRIAELSALSAKEWFALHQLVGKFARDWQAYFEPTRYSAFHREMSRREAIQQAETKAYQ